MQSSEEDWDPSQRGVSPPHTSHQKISTEIPRDKPTSLQFVHADSQAHRWGGEGSVPFLRVKEMHVEKSYQKQQWCKPQHSWNLMATQASCGLHVWAGSLYGIHFSLEFRALSQCFGWGYGSWGPPGAAAAAILPCAAWPAVSTRLQAAWLCFSMGFFWPLDI